MQEASSSTTTSSYEDAFDAMLLGSTFTKGHMTLAGPREATTAPPLLPKKQQHLYASIYLAMPDSITLGMLGTFAGSSSELASKLPKELSSMARRGTPMIVTLKEAPLQQHCLFPCTGVPAIDNDSWHAKEDSRFVVSCIFLFIKSWITCVHQLARQGG